MNKSGFTLIEVAAALVVLVMLVMPMLAARNRTVSSAIDTSNKFVAAQLAASKLDEIASMPLESMDRYGVFEDAPHCRWQFVLEPEDEEALPRLYRVTLVVSYPSPSGEEGRGEIVVSTLVLAGEQL